MNTNIFMMTEQQYWEEIRKVIHVFDKTKDIRKFYHEATDEEVREIEKTLPLIEGLGDLCYNEGRYDEAYNLHYGKALVAALTLWARFKDDEGYYQNVKRLQWKNVRANYHLAINNWRVQQNHVEEPLNDILGRGLWLCAKNPAKGIQLTGINPSYDKNPVEPISPISFKDCHGRYWNPLKKTVLSFVEKDMVAYIDLFPLRVTKQLHEFEKHVPLELKADILRVTYCEIERLRPRLIIHANKTSSFYWGTDIENPWMGYKLKAVETSKEMSIKGKLYQIQGLQKTEKRICQSDKTRLEGTYLFICPYQSGGRSRLSADKKLNDTDILFLWNEYIEK